MRLRRETIWIKSGAGDVIPDTVIEELGHYQFFGIDSNLVRLIWVAISLFAGTGILLYIIAAVLMPKAQNEIVKPESSGDNT